MGGPYGFDVAHGLGLLVIGMFWLIALALIIAVLVLLVRFLLVGTTAAKLYVAKNSPPAASARQPEPGPAAPAAAAPSSAAPPTTAAPTKPVPTSEQPTVPVKKPRTPKAPPAVS